MQAATIAAHRFGYAESSLQPLQSDPRGWVLAQFAAPEPLDPHGLMTGAEAVLLTRRVLRAFLSAAPGAAASRPAPPNTAASDAAAPAGAPGESMAATGPAAAEPAPDSDRQQLRRANLLALQRRWQHVVTTSTPVYERWVLFWSNHFCVAATKGSTLGLVWPHEREAIRPHVTGRIVDLLRAATLHPGMLLYLDNAQSVGPNSRVGQRRERGLNENLARELLELHTLGAGAGYTQADVGETARLLTGWSLARGDGTVRFVPALHEPGVKRVLGRDYPEGPEALDALLLDLSRHPRTARRVATGLARHFVADKPPQSLVDALATCFRDTDGDLLAMARALFGHPLAWRADSPPKFKRPEELLLSAHRVLGLPLVQARKAALDMGLMGQPMGRAPSPQGWPDRTEDWLAPDALYKRVEWAARFATEHAGLAEARGLAVSSQGPDLGAGTRAEIERADSGAQALALWLASPEFQRR